MAFTYKKTITDFLPHFPNIINMTFKDVILKFYPLVADIERLQDFCNLYLNFEGNVDRPPFYFKAALPFVLLQLIDYPRMQQGKLWMRSREVIFGIPIEWYARDGDKLHFRDWGLTFPFIYLDNPISIAVGREIYGLPKAQVKVVDDPTAPALSHEERHVISPEEARRLLAYNLPKFFGDQPADPQDFCERFLEVYQDPHGYPWSVTRPADLLTVWPRVSMNYLSTASTIAKAVTSIPALSAVPNAIIGATRAVAEQLQKVAGMTINEAADHLKKVPIPSTEGFETVAKMMERGLGFAGKWLPEIFAPMTTPRQLPAKAGAPSPFLENQFGLKQFPDAKDPKKACYQAIIRSSCRFDSANDTGLLYDPLSGDPSGGLSIRIYDSEPIVEKLGILAAREPNQEFATVKPFFPFWWNLNVSYGSAENLCWRTSTKWSVPKKDGGHNVWQQFFVALAAVARQRLKLAGEAPAYLSLRTSASRLVVSNAFEQKFPVKLYVLPLKVDDKGLKDLCEKLFEKRFEPSGPYILMFITQFRGMKSGDDQGEHTWSDTQVNFSIPAHPQGNDNPILLSLIGFVGAEWNAITDREIYGRFNLESSFKMADERLVDDLSLSRNPELWFYIKCPLMANKEHELIKRAYSMLSVSKKKIEDDQKKEKIRAKDLDEDRNKLWGWLGKVGLVPDGQREAEYRSVALKQFRDAQDPVKEACYQADVTVTRRLTEIKNKTFVDEGIDLQVNIREFDTARLAQQLGLGKVKLPNIGTSPMPYDDPGQVRGKTPPRLQEVSPKIEGEYEIVADWPIQIEANLSGGDVSENVVGV